MFRYALERWPADPFTVTIFHRGPLDETSSKLVRALEATSDRALANLYVSTVDLNDSVREPDQKLWNDQTNASLPWMVVQFPESDEMEHAAWVGPFNGDTALRLVDSPARREIGKRILNGQSAVWVLIESGNKTKDEEAAKLLETQFTELKDILEIPEIDPDDPRTEVNTSLRIEFSTVRVSQTDPQESIFLGQMLQINPDVDPKKEPIVVPIFGRGRALDALHGNDLVSTTIQSAAAFLCGACSCEVKAMNPGVDMLFAVDWESMSESGSVIVDPPLPPLVSLATLAQAASPVSNETSTATAPGEPPEETTAHTSPLLRNILVIVLLSVAVIAFATIGFNRKSTK